jgi:hypothetical protein
MVEVVAAAAAAAAAAAVVAAVVVVKAAAVLIVNERLQAWPLRNVGSIPGRCERVFLLCL